MEKHTKTERAGLLSKINIRYLYPTPETEPLVDRVIAHEGDDDNAGADTVGKANNRTTEHTRLTFHHIFERLNREELIKSEISDIGSCGRTK